jgi:hypothetical protein
MPASVYHGSRMRERDKFVTARWGFPRDTLPLLRHVQQQEISKYPPPRAVRLYPRSLRFVATRVLALTCTAFVLGCDNDDGTKVGAGGDTADDGAARSPSAWSCGRVDSISDDKGETTVGLPIHVQGTLSAPNLDALSFAWSASPASSGTLQPPVGTGAAASTTFTCRAAGVVTITLTAADGATPDGASSCDPIDEMSLRVVCDPSPRDAAASADAR